MQSLNNSTQNNDQDIALIAARLERLPFTRYQLSIFTIIATAWFFDSIDLGSLTFVLGSIKTDLALTTTQAGLLSSMSFLGMFFGATVAGISADRFGRKNVFQISMIIWGLGSILCAFAPNAFWLGITRLILGFGMGMEFPVAQALIAEMVPALRRGKYIAILEGFWPLGFITAGVIALLVLPHGGLFSFFGQRGGWRDIFFIEGLPALLLFVARRFVPESPRWLASRGEISQAYKVLENIEHNVQKLIKDETLPSAENITPNKLNHVRFRVAFFELWHGIYLKRTIMIWLLWFFAMLGYYGLTTWLTTIMQQSGYGVTKSVYYTILISFGGIPGFITAAWLLEAAGRRITTTGFVAASAVFAYLYGTAGNETLLVLYGLGMQFCFFGMWSVIYAYTPELYPTRVRATGAGCASSVGRIGALLGPSIVGYLLPLYGQVGVFMFGAGAFLSAAIVVITLGVETKGETLENIAP